MDWDDVARVEGRDVKKKELETISDSLRDALLAYARLASCNAHLAAISSGSIALIARLRQPERAAAVR